MLTQVLGVLGHLTESTGQSQSLSDQEVAGPRWHQWVYRGKELRPPITPGARTRQRGKVTEV